MTAPMLNMDPSAIARVENVFFRVRWLMWLLVVPIAWLDNGAQALDSNLWIWMALVAILNAALGIVLRFVKRLPAQLPAAMLVLDSLLFGALPHILPSEANLLAFFALFPALVGAIRFGPAVGLVVAGLLALPIEARAVVAIFQQRNLAALTAGLPVAAVIAATALIGFLSQQEKQAVLGGASQELTELRHALAGAEMLYKMTDVLRTSTSYEPVFEAMLDAGVKGLFQVRQNDEPAVGVVLLVDEMDPEGKLRVITHRHLERRDTGQRIAGKSGVTHEAIQSGKMIVFDNIGDDPELNVFAKLRRCHAGVCFPLQAGLEVYGVVILATPAPRRPTPQLLDLMRAFANQAAVTFQNAHLYRELRAEHDKIIRTENDMRQKLARDLHDGPTQQVAALVMQMEYIGKLIDQDPAEAKRELEKASGIAQAAVKSIRTAMFT
ncbi:MAG: GAF domain-containing protein, partial [Chloroflexi bacterium]|nr:GAF domain-containing protein [Chloroflexota bacterium]